MYQQDRPQPTNESARLELVLANGKSHTFRSGGDMYQWAIQNQPKMDFKMDQSLSDWFGNRKTKK